MDGAGKSTQIAAFCDWLRARSYEVVECRDPGSTALGERIREILLTPDQHEIGMRAEMLLYMAARAQLVDEVIRPGLQRGAAVVSDRFLIANLVYQGHAGGLQLSDLEQTGAFAIDGVEPHLTFLLDVDPDEAARRRQGEPDRIEQRGRDYFARVRAGYRAEATKDPGRVIMIDAGQSVDAVQHAIRSAAERIVLGS